MPKFISDEDMAKLESSQPKKKFISDEEMVKLESTQSPKQEFDVGESVIRPITQATGAAVGTIAGLASPIPGGAVLGGGLGYAAGEQAYRIGKAILGKEKPGTLPEELKKSAEQVQTGVGMELAGAGIPVVGKAIKETAGKALQSVRKAVYKVPEEAISIFKSRPQDVEAIATKPVYETGKDILQSIQSAKNAKVGEATKKIEQSLTKATNEGKMIDLNPAIAEYEAAASKLKGVGEQSKSQKNELLRQAQVLRDIQAQAESGMISPIEANQIKKELQNEAYFQEGIYKTFKNDPIGKAHAKASNKLKSEIEKVAPEIKENNKVISDILNIETNKRFKNAFSEAGIENTLKNVQSQGGNKGQIRELINKADKTLGTNLKEQTENVYAAKYFANPDLLSSSVTGRSLLTGQIGGAIGGSVAGWPGYFTGTAIGTAVGSPKVLKAGVKASKMIEDIVSKIPDLQTKEAVKKALMMQLMRSKEGE